MPLDSASPVESEAAVRISLDPYVTAQVALWDVGAKIDQQVKDPKVCVRKLFECLRILSAACVQISEAQLTESRSSAG